MMSSELLPASLCANPCTSTVFRVCSLDPQFPGSRPYGLDADGSIMAENPWWPATWLIAHQHLHWRKIRTPFISVFNQYWKALDWAERLGRKGWAHIHIVVIDTYTVPQGKLWNAHQIAVALRFPKERLQYHEHEYLFYRSIERKRILAVLPAKGPRLNMSVHLGTLTLPELCFESIFESIGSQDINAVKAYLREWIYRRCGWRDEILLQQTVLALCNGQRPKGKQKRFERHVEIGDSLDAIWVFE